MTIKLRVLSLGAGVQSTTLALMAAHGEIGPMPDCAIFADTGDEKRATYRTIDWIEKQVPFTIHRVRRPGGTLAEHTIEAFASGINGSTPGFYTKNPDGRLPFYCSKEFKTRAVITKCRETIGLQPKQRGPSGIAVEVWIAFTRDEASRMRPAEPPWMQNRWPLIEVGLRRSDCPAWLVRNGYPVPVKSACVYCPNHDDAQWEDMKENPADDDWQRAVAFDASARTGVSIEGQCFVHRALVPLTDVAFDRRTQLDLFAGLCDGACGT